MTQREDAIKFETARIRVLQEERLHIQKKTFTKWMNSFLAKARMEVEDLFTDLADGKMLLKLLEIISGEKLGKPNHGRMRVHKIENVNKSLAFLHTKVRLESIGAEDIVDGNPRLILGLIWTIILRFQIQEIEIDVDEENESSEKKSAKDALLLWCQRKTYGYPGVHIQDFTSSWRSGLGFNALIHSHRPDLIDYNSLIPSQHIDNLNNAFDVGQKHLGIAKLLDAEDVDINKPDEKSVITYVASYYHTFAKMKSEMKGGRRIANIIRQLMEIDKMKERYESFTSTLLEWIRMKIMELNDRNLPNSLEGIQKELLNFKEYRTVEKPPRYKERSEIEALYFSINARLSELRHPSYNPTDGLFVHDIEKAWELLDKAEHQREVALRDELLRLERLEQLAYKFERKSMLRNNYVKEMIQVLSDPRYGSNLSQVEATLKKHEAIIADILARKERFHDLTNMANELQIENYHGKDKIKEREEMILEKWKHLLELLEKHKSSLLACNNLMAILREVDTVAVTIQEMKDSFNTDDLGCHLAAIEMMNQKQTIVESEIISMGDTIKRLNKQGQQYIVCDLKDGPALEKRLKTLNTEYENLLKLSQDRRFKLDEARNYLQFIQDHEDEECWVIEKQRICQTGILAKDLRAVLNLQQKHKNLEDESKSRFIKSQKLNNEGVALITQNHPHQKIIQERVHSLKNNWEILHQLLGKRKKNLEEAAEACQFYTDANEADSWMKEKLPLVASQDLGSDEPSAQSLLQRHKDLLGEIKAYQGDIDQLNDQAKKLTTAGISFSNIIENPSTENASNEEWTQELRMVPEEIWEEEPQEKVDYKMVLEEREVPQVKALYVFNGQGITMSKGEVLFLLNKTNDSWWNVKKLDGQDGFVPANYVKEIEPKLVAVKVRKPVLTKEIKRIKRTKMVKKLVPVRKNKTENTHQAVTAPQETVQNRIQRINATYQDLGKLSQQRLALLEDAIRLFGFYRECTDFEHWMRDKEKALKNDSEQDVEDAKRIFETFLTDLSAASKRVEEVDDMVTQLEKQGHSQIHKVKKRQQEIHNIWNNLNHLKQLKERSLEGASSVELYNRTCDEAEDWMSEKMMKLDNDELGWDLKTVQALQRKHLQLERELAPIEDKFNRVNLLANSVKASYPHEEANVTTRQTDLQSLWNKLKGKAAERRMRLEEAVGLQIFMNSTKTLLNWVGSVKEALNSDESARDVVTAENLLKKHQDLGDDIRAHQDEFEELSELGGKLLKRNPGNKEIKDKLMQIEEEQKALHRGWQQKDDWLRQCRDLQVFNKEADHIDTTTNAHEAFLEFKDMGSTLDGVEALLKRNEDFQNTLFAQDERLKSFSDMAEKLIAAGHYDKTYIKERRDNVWEKRQSVKDKAMTRQEMLQHSKAYFELIADQDETQEWIRDKLKIASDESYRDLSNLERNLQKHLAFESELRSNEGRLRKINKTNLNLISEKHYRSNELQESSKSINKNWQNLCDKTSEKGKKLRQAASLHGFNKIMEDVRIRLSDIESALKSNDKGSDLKSCKQLLKKRQLLENETGVCEQKIKDLINIGEEMAQDGHFDAENIIKSGLEFEDRLQKLKSPLILRKQQLEDSLKYYEFVFEVNMQLQWIQEHLPAASSEVIGNNLHDAQNLFKKHKKLETEILGHKPMIDRTLGNSNLLLEQDLDDNEKIKLKCEELKEAWENLNEKVKTRAKKLELSLKSQQYFFDASEVESWMTEKSDILNSKDVGKDEEGAIKLLTKHKALELELDSYTGLVSEMGSIAQTMIKTNHPDSKVISSRQSFISQQLKDLQKLANSRRKKLLESMYRHEYFRESKDLETWIDQQMIIATSEDFGKDYEHLQLILNKYQEFKCQVEAGHRRFRACEDLAKKLIANDNPYAIDLNTCQEQLSAKWHSLMEHIEARDKKLAAAGEIHRYSYDAQDALSRIQEKYSIFSDDLGKDLHSVQNLIRKHEGFENDLAALEGQIQMLINDSTRLQALYPGPNANWIKDQQDNVVENWKALSDKAISRKDELQNSLLLHTFLADARDLISWAVSLRSTMMTEEKASDVGSAEILLSEHDQTKGEIDARENRIKLVEEEGKDLIKNGHYASKEIKEKLDHLESEYSKLRTSWHNKKVYLEQLQALQVFRRDAKQLDTISSSQEAALLQTEFGSTVEEVDGHLKKHEALEKIVYAQDDKTLALQEFANKLINQHHFNEDDITKKMEDIVKRREKIKMLAQLKRKKLDDAQLYVQFVRDVSESESGIEELKLKLESDKIKPELVTNLEDKIKKLKKHQAFQAKLDRYQPVLLDIQSKGDKLVENKHKCSPDVKCKLEQLFKKWNDLVHESKECGRGLDEAQDILEFNDKVEKIETWMRNKELMVQAEDKGRDYEHCLELQKKLEDRDNDSCIDESKVKEINALADKLVKKNQSDHGVQSRREELNSKWNVIQKCLHNYRQLLAGALEIHGFNRDVDDINDRISEKELILSNVDLGKDLQSVESLQRKQEVTERDMTAIDGKLKEIEVDAQSLTRKYPDRSDSISAKLSEASNNWEKLINICTKRRQDLKTSHELQKFNQDLKELENWTNDIVGKMKSSAFPDNAAELKSLCELHQERKAEIDGRQETIKHLKSVGQGMMDRNHYAVDSIKSNLKRLVDLQSKLSLCWEEIRIFLSRAQELQTFEQLALNTESWLATKEAFLNNDDIGDSIASVDNLIRKHDNFEKTLVVQKDKIEELKKFATKLMDYDKDRIERRMETIFDRNKKLQENRLLRKKKLDESRLFQQFLRNIFEVEAWISEKLQVALDESYRDPSNLQSKIKKHQAFEAEIVANKGLIDSVINEGEQLIKDDHFAKSDIDQCLKNFMSLWNQLQEGSLVKKNRLDDAYQALLFRRTLDDLDTWMDDVESQILSEDHGKDLISVQNLLKKHQLLEQDITNHGTNIDQIKTTAKEFNNSNHFMHEEISSRTEATVKRYKSLEDPLQTRGDNLEDSQLLQQFKHDVEDELSWIAEKEPIAMSTDLGTSLTAVHNLQKKHQALETEIQSHEPFVATLKSKGQQMLKSQHFAASIIKDNINELMSKFQTLKDGAIVRRLRLSDALQSQTLYTEIQEAVAWIQERRPLLISSDTGKDETSLQLFQKKLEALKRDVENYEKNVNKLKEDAQSLTTRGHFDSEIISKRMNETTNNFDELKALLLERECKLHNNKKLLSFLREADETVEWIQEQSNIAGLEYYGSDVEDVEILIQKFEIFMTMLNSNEERVLNITDQGLDLIASDHPESDQIKMKTQEIVEVWSELKELASTRQEALSGAKLVHMFDRSASETVTWILEKNVILITEDHGNDLEATQALVRKHHAFERDLAAIKEQVDTIGVEADKLVQMYPNTSEHISVQHGNVTEAWNTLLKKSAARKDKLNQAEKLQAYFDEYRSLLTWINEMIAKVTAPELAKDVIGAETLILHHMEYKTEMDTRIDSLSRFIANGKKLIEEGHFMSDEIDERLNTLQNRLSTLQQTWEKRRILYDQHLDTQIFLRDASQLETWLQTREPILYDTELGTSISEVEELIKKYQDFETTVIAQEDRFSALKRITLLEKAFQDMKKFEEEARKAEQQRREQERHQAIKRREVQRITDERKREDERRRTQEIKFNREDLESLPSASTFYTPSSSSDAQTSYLSPDKNQSVENLSKTGSNPNLSDKLKKNEMSFMKRAESMRIDGSGKKLRRTPSFTTRRRTQSFRKLKGSEASPPNLSAVEIYGYLDRKQELQTGGRRATVRSWKMYYTVLCGQLLCFFKDEDDFTESKAAAPPLNLYHATCEKAQDYTKKKNVFRLHTTDGSEYLFMAEDEKMLEEWVVKISFHANLTPSLQLTSYDSQLKCQNVEDEIPVSEIRIDDVPPGSNYPHNPKQQCKYLEDDSDDYSDTGYQDPNAEKENYRKPEHISTATINIVQKDEQIRTPLRNSEPPASYTYNGNNVPNVDYYQHNKRISADNYAKAIEPPPLPMNPPPNRTASNMHQDHFWKNENAVDADSSKRQIKMYQSDRAELRNRPFDVSLNAQSKAHQYPDERRPVTEDENKKDRRSNSVLHGLFKRRKGTHV